MTITSPYTNRTLAPDYTYTREQVRYVDVLASCKVAGYVFLVHRSIDRAEKFVTTYAPVGMHAGEYNSIEDAVEALRSQGDELVTRVVVQAIARMESDYLLLLAPETGLQSFDWQWREQCRFDSGEYGRMPAIDGREWPKHHYLHLSVTKQESDFVAYTPNESYGLADRQVRLKFGKYLRKTFPDMTDAEIQTAVRELRAKLVLAESPAVLKFATDESTINEIFETEMYAQDSNCTSCMHGKFDRDSLRPYHVYADSPDVAVAYVTEYGAIIARSVVSTKDEIWVRAYSTHENDSTYCQVLIDLLKQAGYSKGDLNGNRLRNLGDDCIPYIDNGGKGIRDCGKYWEVCDENEGDYNADCTDGTASSTRPQCDRCEHDEDDCQCSSCPCCEEMYYEESNCNCEFCQECEECTRHDNCQCERCSDCGEIISPSSRYTNHCECDRCADCNELTDDCECETDEDEAEVENESEVAPETAPKTVAEVSA